MLLEGRMDDERKLINMVPDCWLASLLPRNRTSGHPKPFLGRWVKHEHPLQVAEQGWDRGKHVQLRQGNTWK